MKKVCAMFCAVMIAANLTAAMSATAANGMDDTGDAVVMATGLIYNRGISISSSNSQLYINAFVEATSTMKSIGFTDIQIQRSRNGNAGWTTVQTLSDVLASDTNSCAMNNYAVTIDTGYYYRVKCNYYAKETGIWFPGTETILATSNVVYGE